MIFQNLSIFYLSRRLNAILTTDQQWMAEALGMEDVFSVYMH